MTPKLIIHVKHPEFANPNSWSILYLQHCSPSDDDARVIAQAKLALLGISAIRIAREYGVDL
jgi:hypothetical protein